MRRGHLTPLQIVQAFTAPFDGSGLESVDLCEVCGIRHRYSDRHDYMLAPWTVFHEGSPWVCAATQHTFAAVRAGVVGVPEAPAEARCDGGRIGCGTCPSPLDVSKGLITAMLSVGYGPVDAELLRLWAAVDHGHTALVRGEPFNPWLIARSIRDLPERRYSMGVIDAAGVHSAPGLALRSGDIYLVISGQDRRVLEQSGPPSWEAWCAIRREEACS